MFALAGSYWYLYVSLSRKIFHFSLEKSLAAILNAGVYRNAIGISHASTADFLESTVTLAFLDP